MTYATSAHTFASTSAALRAPSACSVVSHDGPPQARHAINKCAGVILIDPWHENVADPRTYRIMVIKQKYSGVWGLPKGHLEADEDTFTAAWREFGEETGVQLAHLREGVDYLKVDMRRGGHVSRATATGAGFAAGQETKDLTMPPAFHANHQVLKKIHFYAYVLLHHGQSLVHHTFDTKEVAAISWMNVFRWFIDPLPSRYEPRQLPSGEVVVVPVTYSTPAAPTARSTQPPRFNRTLGDTSVHALQDTCVRACHSLQALYAHANVSSHSPQCAEAGVPTVPASANASPVFGDGSVYGAVCENLF